ncbi:MAG: glycosyltransferase family 9 protein [Candidatus Latescibacterota bacterium]|nr:MAG: glycosyltransferase family 9 protein [Candidatus Latescibacterota bacterium]
MRGDPATRAAEELTRGGRVLVSRLQYLGDVILTLPAVYALRDRYPQAEIDYLARDAGADVLSGEPIFSRIFKLPTRQQGRLAMLRFLRDLRQRKYSAVIDLYSNPRSALLTRLTDAALRIGGDRRGRRRLYTHPTRTPSTVRRATDHHLYYLKPLGVSGPASKPSLTISDAERGRALERLREFGIEPGDGPVVGVHPGGKWEVKRWPIPQYAELGRRLADNHGLRLVVFSGPGEGSYQSELRDLLGERAVYLPTLPIRETAALVESLDGIVVCDGGIMHLSVAVGTPTVGIFGSSEPDIWFPYEEFGPYRPIYVPIDCRPCHSHVCSHLSCLLGLTVDAVERKLLDVMGAGKSSQRSLGS